MASYTLTNTLSDITANNITLYLVPAEGKELPPSELIDNGIYTDGTILSYDATNGILVMSSDTTYVNVYCSVYPTAVPNTPTATVAGPFLVIKDDSILKNKANTFSAEYYSSSASVGTATINSSKL
jgi:hypothetical protein